MKTNTGKVSVVVPAHDAAAFLPETLDSILSQDYPDLEVIVVDDGSTDDTPEVMKAYADRVTYLRQAASGGPSRPRNVGVDAATGDFVAFFDSDDLMDPGAVADSMAVFAAHPEVDFVFGGSRAIDEQGTVIIEDYLAEYTDFRQFLEPVDDPAVGLMQGSTVYRQLLRANFIFTCGVIMRGDLLARTGPFDESLKNGDDRDMWMRAALTGCTFAFIDRPHFSYRKRGGSVTRRGWRRMPSVIRMLEKHRGLVKRAEDKSLLDYRINRAWLALAYGARLDGHLDEAAAAYREALRGRFSMLAWRGMIKTQFMRLFGR